MGVQLDEVDDSGESDTEKLKELTKRFEVLEGRFRSLVELLQHDKVLSDSYTRNPCCSACGGGSCFRDQQRDELLQDYSNYY